MRLGGRLVVAALAVGVVAGCGAATDTSGKGGGTTEEEDAGEPWILVEPGNPTPSPGANRRFSPRSGLPPVSYPPSSSACAIAWPQNDMVLIPMIVTPVAGGFKVEWPASYGKTYRLTAVHQDLVAGAQPEPTWQTVTAAGTDCSVTATITGLISGEPYIVWLDAPETPRGLDGSRSLYSGKSGVVKPL